jgi:hypothetical protein
VVEKAVGYMGDPPADDFVSKLLYHGKGRRARKNGKCQRVSILKLSSFYVKQISGRKIPS